MKNKTVDITLRLIVVFLFCGYFWFKDATWDYNTYLKSFNQIEEYAKNGEWDSAKSLADEMKEKWHEKNYIIMINYAEAEFSLFEESLNHIVAGIEGEELAEVLSYTKNARDLWINFNRVVPEP